jgi:hypothetical protein
MTDRSPSLLKGGQRNCSGLFLKAYNLLSKFRIRAIILAIAATSAIRRLRTSPINLTVDIQLRTGLYKIKMNNYNKLAPRWLNSHQRGELFQRIMAAPTLSRDTDDDGPGAA